MLERAILTGANLAGANLQAGNLMSADLMGSNLNGANFQRAHVENVNLKGADLTRSNFEFALLCNAEMSEANLEGANFGSADLRGAHYDGEDCVKRSSLKNAKIGAVDWSNKDMRGAQLQGCELQGCQLTNTNLWYANFEGAVLTGADLTGSRFDAETCAKRGWLRGATVGPVDWSGKDLGGAQLQGVDMQGASLKNAHLVAANFERANAQGVNMMNANLTQWKAFGANLCGVNFYRADLRQAELRTDMMDGNTYFGNAQVAGAIISSRGWQRAFAVGTLRADGVDRVHFDGLDCHFDGSNPGTPPADGENSSPQTGELPPMVPLSAGVMAQIEGEFRTLIPADVTDPSIEGEGGQGVVKEGEEGMDEVDLLHPGRGEGSNRGLLNNASPIMGSDHEDHDDTSVGNTIDYAFLSQPQIPLGHEQSRGQGTATAANEQPEGSSGPRVGMEDPNQTHAVLGDVEFKASIHYIKESNANGSGESPSTSSMDENSEMTGML